MEPDFSNGLLPAVVQDAASHEVLMLAWMDAESWARTKESGRAWFHSRSRGLWEKGATSGNYLTVVERKLDCDADAILLRVEAAGPACHTGARSCFFNDG
jgi:phosphoribosyl-AMP cyclohydrolase